MMLNGEIWSGVNFFLDHYVKPVLGDHVVIAYTPDSREPCGWVWLALQERGISVETLWMAPIHDDDLANRLRRSILNPISLAGRLVIITLELETMSHDSKFKEAVRNFDKSKYIIFRAISACSELFTSTLSADPLEIDMRNAYLLNNLVGANSIRVTTSSGSDILVELDSRKYQWVSNRGKAKSGRISILPPGEIATFPANVNGKFVADFAFNLNAITKRDTRLTHSPVTVYIENGRAVRFECQDKEIYSFLSQCFNTLCAFNIGELGLGTNSKVVNPIPLNSHINERKPGIHLGFGQHNQDPGVVGYQCNIHLDLVASDGLIYVDGKLDPIDLVQFPVVYTEHPDGMRDEDVFAPDLDDIEVEDCCGILRHGENGLSVFDCPQPNNSKIENPFPVQRAFAP